MPKKTAAKQKPLVKYLPKMLLVLCAIVLLSGVVVSLKQRSDNAQVIKQIASSVIPSTDKPAQKDSDNYKVAADLPHYIFIPKIGVSGIVRPLGLVNDNKLGTPSNIYEAGWFNQSSKPGQPGAMVVDGHVSSQTAEGIFYHLKSLAAGDTIQIELGNGTKISYTVVKSQTYDVASVDMTAVLAPVNPGKPGLNLITCAGNVIKGTYTFDKRIVVFAEQS